MEAVTSLRFRQTYWVAVSVFIVTSVAPLLATDDVMERWQERQRGSLAGLTGVSVVVERLRPEVEREGLTQLILRTDVELKLRQAGIRVLTETERLEMPGAPFLYLRVSTSTREAMPYAFNIALELRQWVRLLRDPTLTTLGTTWYAVGSTGIVGSRHVADIREVVRDAIDQFINAYLAANPKR